MKVFVTGGTGYSGQAACREFAAHGHRVVTMSRDLSQPVVGRLRALEVEVVEGSVADADSYAQAVEEADLVVHNTMDHDDPEGSDQTLLKTLAAAAPLRGGRRRLVYTTGCSIYGPRPEPVMDENTPGNPDHALFFRMELEKDAFALRPDWGVVVLRPGFMYGQGGDSCQAMMWARQAEEGAVTFRGDRDKGWSWVHVADLARAYRLAGEADRGVDGEVYCVADELSPTCLEVARAAADAAGFDGEIQFGPPDESDLTSQWFDQDEYITSGKIRRHLGWWPTHRGVLDAMPRLYAAWKAAQEAEA